MKSINNNWKEYLKPKDARGFLVLGVLFVVAALILSIIIPVLLRLVLVVGIAIIIYGLVKRKKEAQSAGVKQGNVSKKCKNL